MQEFIPYTYLIGWSKQNLWYYGSEYKNNKSKVANPANLWNTYFTSSKRVATLRKEFGEPDVIQIRKIFTTAIETASWETRVLKRMNVVKKYMWLNLQCGDGKFRRSLVPRELKDETRIKLSLANKGKKRSPEQNKRNSEVRKGVKRSAESIAKQQATRKARGYHSKEYLKAIGMDRTGKTHTVSEEAKQKMSVARLAHNAQKLNNGGKRGN